MGVSAEFLRSQASGSYWTLSLFFLRLIYTRSILLLRRDVLTLSPTKDLSPTRSQRELSKSGTTYLSSLAAHYTTYLDLVLGASGMAMTSVFFFLTSWFHTGNRYLPKS
ncbi:hypothetical protein GGS21DRAFT_8870 [Xylaria nigripes]|nr:hypothetical protein GGS21DRAFT_8870 [Xylaria nigripes]